jgi:hypothetical protein
MSADTSGPAFPCRDDALTYAGMTLRDYFAAQLAPAMIRMIADGLHQPDIGQSPKDSAARAAYNLADALLKAREHP